VDAGSLPGPEPPPGPHPATGPNIVPDRSKAAHEPNSLAVTTVQSIPRFRVTVGLTRAATELARLRRPGAYRRPVEPFVIRLYHIRVLFGIHWVHNGEKH